MRAKLFGLIGTIRAGLTVVALLAATQSTPAQTPAPKSNVFPPWQHGANNDALDRGVDFTVPQIDDLADFHADLSDPKLVLYVGGNYFFAMAALVQAFEASHPDYKGRIYWKPSRRACLSISSRPVDASPSAI
jgi:molybdate transport system substrate-binding protein